MAAFASSYIPTVASQVTRSADAASMTGANFSSWYRADEGVIVCNYVTANAPSAANNFTLFSANDNTAGNAIQAFRRATTLNELISNCVVSAGNQAFIASGTWATGNNTLAFGYKVNDFASSYNGAAVVTDVSGTVPVVSQFDIGNARNTSTSFLNGHIRKLSYYPKRLANAEVAALTQN
jgi:hypothetical protein